MRRGGVFGVDLGWDGERVGSVSRRVGGML